MAHESTFREELITYLERPFERVPMDIRVLESRWHLSERIPNEPGWYFIETNVPVEVLQNQRIEKRKYDTKTGKQAFVKHYDLVKRSSAYSKSLEGLFAGPIVYSGIASSLRNRAREHTKANAGTAALSLNNYRVLKNPEYQWWFHYATLNGFFSGFKLNRVQQGIVLRLGEQIWRGRNGWPVLCAG